MASAPLDADRIVIEANAAMLKDQAGGEVSHRLGENVQVTISSLGEGVLRITRIPGGSIKASAESPPDVRKEFAQALRTASTSASTRVD